MEWENIAEMLRSRVEEEVVKNELALLPSGWCFLQMH